jgi:hypothetical protein
MGERRSACKVLVGKSEGRRKLGRSKRRWEANVNMGLYEVGWDSMNCTNIGQDMSSWPAVVKAVMKFSVS